MSTTTGVVLAEHPAEREAMAVAGFLAGYDGATRTSYATNLRMFASWCRGGKLSLFSTGPCHRTEALSSSSPPDRVARSRSDLHVLSIGRLVTITVWWNELEPDRSSPASRIVAWMDRPSASPPRPGRRRARLDRAFRGRAHRCRQRSPSLLAYMVGGTTSFACPSANSCEEVTEPTPIRCTMARRSSRVEPGRGRCERSCALVLVLGPVA